MAEHSIKVLPVDVANMIAAGEVVDRPSSVLKELMENSLDAGSTQVDVEITSGGRRLVAVSDNGAGMNRDDALLSIERHATSKIRDVHDIERIATLGFRGEALAALSSVSRFRLVTCRRGETTGTELTMSGGKLQDVRDVGVPAGTLVEVRDVFFNVPARRKFLRSEQTELSHVRQTFMVQALAHPAVGMSLRVDGRELYNMAGGATLEDRIRELFGAEFLGKLRPVEFTARGVRVSGRISVPSINRSDRNEQFIFVNSRPTSVPLLNFAISEGYRTLLPSNRFPSLFLAIEIDPALVDVNVHPTKKEVRFKHTDDIRDTVVEAIRAALSDGSSLTTAAVDGVFSKVQQLAGIMSNPVGGAQPGSEESRLAIEDLPPTRAFRYPRMPVIPSGQPTESVSDKTDMAGSEDSNTAAAQESLPVSREQAAQLPSANPPWSWCRVLGQIGGLYVLLETEEGFVVMDPHAAHERILFERFMTAIVGGNVESQGLLMPETVEFRPADSLRIRKNMGVFRKMGFGIAEFGGDAIVVDALPSCFAGVSARALMVDIAQALEQAGARGGKEMWKEEAIAQAACKAAVKARDRMALKEIEQLVIDLAQTEMPYTCPHGRPTLIFTPFADLNRKFGRGSG